MYGILSSSFERSSSIIFLLIFISLFRSKQRRVWCGTGVLLMLLLYFFYRLYCTFLTRLRGSDGIYSILFSCFK